jgi:hypothetical protein
VLANTFFFFAATSLTTVPKRSVPPFCPWERLAALMSFWRKKVQQTGIEEGGVAPLD